MGSPPSLLSSSSSSHLFQTSGKLGFRRLASGGRCSSPGSSRRPRRREGQSSVSMLSSVGHPPSLSPVAIALFHWFALSVKPFGSAGSLCHAPLFRRLSPAPSLNWGRIANSMMGSAQDWAFGWQPWTGPALEDLLPQLSHEEQLRLHNHLREHERILKWHNKNSPPISSLHSEGERDSFIIIHVRYALHHYNAKHPDEEFDAVKPLMESRVRFRGQVWFHINFWARSRKSKKIKRFFAEVRYKPPSSSSSVCSYLPFPVPGAERPPSSSSVSSDLPLPLPIPVVEACTIIEEPLGQYRKSCAFCRGHLDILHPMGRKFVCGNDKDRLEQQLLPCGSIGLEMPFTCRLGPASVNSSHGEKED
uniref:DUF3615 domain-containing protein n=1 Tax=Oryza glumipatula TaxID=40148 RepID=A0A0E0BMQ1_9ORYZ